MAKHETSFWARGLGRFLVVLLLIALGAVGGVTALLYSITHPPRDKRSLDPADVLLRTVEVTLQSVDGIHLSGWFVSGRPGAPAILLCHDLGGARSSLLNSAVSLNRAGYPLLLFDFRGHGRSGGKGSTLGIDERLDVLGALAYLRTRRDVDPGRFGVWGIGMGGYAAALAAAEDKEIVALALDSLYPDVETQLDRLVRAQIPPAFAALAGGIRPFYAPYFAFKPRRYTLERPLAELAGRNLLLIAGSDLPDRFQEGKALYASVPESPSGFKNFLELKASFVGGLYAEDKKQYDKAIVAFFQTSLKPSARPGDRASKPIQVIER